MELYGATRKQTNVEFNEDAFLILRDPCPIAILADGVGNARGAARQALKLFQRLIRHKSASDLQRYFTWVEIFRNIDACLSGGYETTLIAAAFIGSGVYGANCGDSRLYLFDLPDCYGRSVANDSKPRIGNGEAVITPIHVELKDNAFALMQSDGAWREVDRLSVLRAINRVPHFSELPGEILSHENRHGCIDDMTIIAIRR